MTPDDYLYDVFVSYRRTDPVRGWVHNHFHPALKEWIGEHFPPRRRPEVFIDQRIETGSQWADELQHALLRSRCLVCVWSPSYFGQDWCLAEWMTMCERERVLRERGVAPARLVYPVRFNDGDSFPADARAAHHLDLSRYNNPHPSLRETGALHHEFVRTMQVVAEEVARMALAAPAWEAGWPLVPAGPAPAAPAVPLLRL